MITKPHLKLKTFLNMLPLFYSFIPQKTESLRLIKKYHNKNLLFDFKFIPRYAILFLSIIVWPFWSVVLSVRALKKNGKQVKEKFGKTVLKQFIELLYFSNIHLIMPNHYYNFSLFKKENQKDVSFYLFDGPAQRVFRSINRNLDLSILDDKLKFFEFCQKHKIPTPPIIALFSKGELKYQNNFSKLPESDLIFKLRNGSMSRGLTIWEFIGNNFYRSLNTKEELTQEELINYFIEFSTQEDYILQPRLYDKDGIKELSNSTLSTIRMVTTINRKNEVRELFSIFEIPIPNAPTNIAIPCFIDSAKGILGEVSTPEIENPLYEISQCNIAKYKGKILPDWNECKNIAKLAHLKVGRIPFIGWDICITNEGCMILEGNHGIRLNSHQLPPNQPFGKTEFTQIMSTFI